MCSFIFKALGTHLTKRVGRTKQIKIDKLDKRFDLFKMHAFNGIPSKTPKSMVVSIELNVKPHLVHINLFDTTPRDGAIGNETEAELAS